ETPLVVAGIGQIGDDRRLAAHWFEWPQRRRQLGQRTDLAGYPVLGQGALRVVPDAEAYGGPGRLGGPQRRNHGLEKRQSQATAQPPEHHAAIDLPAPRHGFFSSLPRASSSARGARLCRNG